jgi:ComF family protein
MKLLSWWEDLIHLFYPHLCAACAHDLPSRQQIICPACISQLPKTFDETALDNPTAKMFAGRMDLCTAWSTFYFHKGGMMQLLIHEIKYKKEKSLGIFMGELMGESMKSISNVQPFDAIVPLPMHASKERQRGYNQAMLIAEGVSLTTGIPVINDAIIKTKKTTSQTNKQRTARWKNAEGNFKIIKPESLQHKHLLLIDDVITTGATLEACGSVIMKTPGIQLSIATLARAA